MADVFGIVKDPGTCACRNTEYLLGFDAQFVVDSAAVNRNGIDGVKTASLGIACAVDAILETFAPVENVAGNDDTAARVEEFEDIFDGRVIPETPPAFRNIFIIDLSRECDNASC